MARSRNIKPGLFENEELAELPIADRFLFTGLWTLADREGRMEDRPKRIKAQVFPYDDLDVDQSLDRLHRAGFIQRYTVDGQRLIAVTTFSKHQSPHKNEAPSVLPGPTTTAIPDAPEPTLPDDSGASTRQAPDKHTSTPSSRGPADSGFSDSLIPDSGYLIPETSAPGAQTPPKPVEQAAGKKTITVVPERNAPQIPPRPPEPPPDDVPPAQPFDLLEALCDEVGADLSVLAKPQKDKQLGVAKRLVESGMTVRDVRDMTRWLLGQDWVTSGVDLFLLEKQLGKWQMQGKPAVAVVRSRGRPTATESVFDEALDETRRKRGRPDENIFDIA